MWLETGWRIGYDIIAPYVKSLEESESEEHRLELETMDASVALLVERNSNSQSNLYMSKWDGVTSESSEHILAEKLENGSDYITKEELEESEKN